MAMIKSLFRFNNQSNKSGANIDFKLRVGIAIGPVIAGGTPSAFMLVLTFLIVFIILIVVGSVKPQYDIWGDTGLK